MGNMKEFSTLEGKSFTFPKNLYYILKECENRVNQNLDAPFIITGSVGSGKTNLLVGIGGVWEEQIHNRPMNLKKLYWNPEKLIEMTNKDDNFTEFLGFDEAIQGGSGRDGNTKIGKILRKTLITKRFKKHLLGVCVDSLKELNDKIIERAVVWVHVHYVRRKDGRYQKGLFKIFSAKQALKVFEDLKDKKYYETKDHPIWLNNRFIYWSNKYMDLYFSENEYNKIKSEETNLLDVSEDKTTWQRDQVVLLAVKHGIKRADIAKAMGLSLSMVGKIVQMSTPPQNTI